MEWFDDSIACLAVARELIGEIQAMTQESITDIRLMPLLKVKIKNCLENCNSPLDYVAQYIFSTYCPNEYTQKELKRYKKVYYPKPVPDEIKFNLNTKEYFRSLITKRPDIVKVLENSQPYKSDPWLAHLTTLINENKHRNLTTQERRDVGVHANHITMSNGMQIQNIRSFGNKGHDVVINGIPFDSQSALNHPTVSSFGATFYVEFIFKELNLPLVPTLKDIYAGTYSVIQDLKRHL